MEWRHHIAKLKCAARCGEVNKLLAAFLTASITLVCYPSAPGIAEYTYCYLRNLPINSSAMNSNIVVHKLRVQQHNNGIYLLLLNTNLYDLRRNTSYVINELQEKNVYRGASSRLSFVSDEMPVGSSDESLKKAMELVQQPRKPLDFVRNCKIALENNLLLKDEFFSDEFLKRFFSGIQIRWYWSRPTSKLAVVHTVENPVKPSPQEEKTAIGAAEFRSTIVDKHNKENIAGLKRASASILCIYNPQFTVELIESVFGMPAEVMDPYATNTHPTPLMSSTHAFGNKKLRYDLSSNDNEKHVSVVTNGDGTINKMICYEGGR
jgi:hypothetical protein